MRNPLRAAASSAVVLLASSAAAVAVTAPPAVAAHEAPVPRPAVKNCGLRQSLFKPKWLFVACGDGNMVGKQLVWTSWSGQQALGHGLLSWNPCTPYCAAVPPSRWRATQARFVLTKSAHTKQGWLFEEMTVHVTGQVPKGFLRTITVSEKPH